MTQAHQRHLFDSTRIQQLLPDDTVYVSLWQAIIGQRLRPGARLPEDALARALSTSRTGIRRALQRLSLEGLVVLAPHRGARVASPTPAEAREIFEARRIIECGLIPAVVRHTTATDTQRLETLVRQEQHAIAQGHRMEAIRLSGEFHIRLFAPAGNTLLLESLAQLVSRTSLLIALYPPANTHPCHCQHGELITLITGGEADQATHWMHHHLEALEKGLEMAPRDTDLPDFDTLFSTTPSSRNAS